MSQIDWLENNNYNFPDVNKALSEPDGLLVSQIKPNSIFRKMGLRNNDIIIGVDVQDGLRNRDELASAPDVLFQINNFRTINDMKLKVEKTDIYIKSCYKTYHFMT